jgi:CII-binding regulator of phage lambda lysogenization HflD
VDYIAIIEKILLVIVLPFVIWVIKLNTKITILETKAQNKKEMFEIIFKKLEENREDLHQVNLKTEKILSKLEK